MNDELRSRIIERLRRGENLPREWAQEIFPPERREYELVYQGKEREGDILANTMAVPLQEVRTIGEDDDSWHNMLILGDNLQVLKRLLEYKKDGRLCNADGTPGVRLIYIDPPFATEQEFTGNQEEIAYQDRIAGARFINFLRARLVLLKELLSPDGSIFVHLDHRKLHYAKVILDELFTERNFRNEIILPGRAAKNLQQQFDKIYRLNVRHDTLLWYSASTRTRFKPFWVEKHKAGNPNGHWHHFWSTANRPTMRYDLFGHTPKTGQWTWEQKRAQQALRNYQRFEKESGGRTLVEYWRDTGCALEFLRQNPEDGTPQYWRAPSEVRLADTLWAGIPIYSNSTGYPTEKNEALLQQVIELASREGDTILDAFAGSGTTLAVAEKLGRRWVGIDRGKLAIYAVQKRLLNLTREIGSKGKPLKPKPFTLYNAGLYDFTTLRQLPREDWRFFALQLFECRDEPHTIGGLKLDGKRRGSSVLVYDHHKNPNAKIDEEAIHSIHRRIGDKISRQFYIIAPRYTFAFQQDYITLDGVRYYALRIPYSFINELHRREFSALQQPKDENAVNDLIDAEGFDFIQPPTVKYKAGAKKRPGQLFKEAYIKLEGFESKARVRGALESRGLDAFSMLLLNLDYNGEVFQLNSYYFAKDLEAADWHAWFPIQDVGSRIMAVFMDIYGNEATQVINRSELKLPPQEK